MPIEAFTHYMITCGACPNILGGADRTFASIPAAVDYAHNHGWLMNNDGGAPVCPVHDDAHLKEIALTHPAAIDPAPPA